MATPAPALLTLRYQLYDLAASRAPFFHGIMGDRAHMLRRSKHNLGEAIDMSTVLLGLERLNHIVEVIRWNAASGTEPRCERIIWARRSCSSSTGWQWVRYWGVNPHELHAHLECSTARRADARCWVIA